MYGEIMIIHNLREDLKKNGIFYDIGINSCIPQPPPPFYDIINYVIQIYVVDPSLLALIMTLSLIQYEINI